MISEYLVVKFTLFLILLEVDKLRDIKILISAWGFKISARGFKISAWGSKIIELASLKIFSYLKTKRRRQSFQIFSVISVRWKIGSYYILWWYWPRTYLLYVQEKIRRKKKFLKSVLNFFIKFVLLPWDTIFHYKLGLNKII